MQNLRGVGGNCLFSRQVSIKNCVGSLVLPVVAGAAVVSAPVVVPAAVVSAPVVVVAAAVVADAVVFSDEPPRSTVARPAIGYKYKSGFKWIKDKNNFIWFFTLQVTLLVTSV